MSLTYHNNPHVSIMWQSSNGRWTLERVSPDEYNPRTVHRLRRRDSFTWYRGQRLPNETVSEVYRRADGSVSCPDVQDVPGYVNRAVSQRLPKKG